MRLAIPPTLLIFLLIISQQYVVLANDNDDDDDNVNGNIQCVDLADFNYEIVMGVTSFPQQGDCSEQEVAEISTFLEQKINDELSAIPGTINTKNKVCTNPINNNHRHLLSLPPPQSNENLTSMNALRSQGLRKSVDSKEESNDRILLRMGDRSFIYVGGGRCLFCFYDNKDQRRLLATPTKTKLLSHRHHHRDLLFLSFRKSPTPIPKVADILLCNQLDSMMVSVMYSSHLSTKWTNRKNTFFKNKIKKRTSRDHLLGPYVAGDRFGVQLDFKSFEPKINDRKQFYIQQYGSLTMVDEPVKEGIISFTLYAFDLPTAFVTGFLADEPFFVFINGIKLDFNLLITQPNVKKIKIQNGDELSGNTFAGIRWKIERLFIQGGEDFSHGPQPDREYRFTITAPFVILADKNKLFDLDFMIKPTAKANQYAIRYMRVRLKAAKCEVTGLETSPFQEFKSVVESRLFHKLGMNLAQQFQSKTGHCLYDKIPVVNVHLVEKEKWQDSNPRC